jgi:hypothetical protein
MEYTFYRMKPDTEPQQLSSVAYLGISAVGLVLALVLLFLFAEKAPGLVRNGISKAFFYVLLFPLGLSTAAFCFGAMHSYARYCGKTLGGVLELGGPVVVAALVVIGGFYLVPAETPRGTFFMKVRFTDQTGSPVAGGTVKLLVRNSTSIQIANPEGEVTFFELPFEFRKKSAQIGYDSAENELKAIILLDDEAPPTLKVNLKKREVRSLPAVVFEETPEEVRSRVVEGWGDGWSAPVSACTKDKPPGWTVSRVYDFHLESTTERNECGKFTTCGGQENDTLTHVCRVVTVQGHNENRFDGWGRAVAVFQVIWKHPRQE